MDEVPILWQVHSRPWGKQREQNRQDSCPHTVYIQEKYKWMGRGKIEKYQQINSIISSSVNAVRSGDGI